VAEGLRRALTGAYFGVLLATIGYLACGDPGSVSRAARLDDTGSASSAVGLLSPAVAAPSARKVNQPMRLTIPAIGVDSGLEALRLRRDGTLAAPGRNERAGWYADGVTPGSTGPAIIAGHVDSTTGPAVFFKLRQLRIGDQIVVYREDRTSARFVVDDVHAYPKNAFPQGAVYGPTTNAVLRLVTCTGDFDFAARSYLDNLVVSAHLV
jgi:sortase (surface protein transpeptidase)